MTRPNEPVPKVLIRSKSSKVAVFCKNSVNCRITVSNNIYHERNDKAQKSLENLTLPLSLGSPFFDAGVFPIEDQQEDR
uniref:Uncharacterized protein n=1 Tax=Romanomermis culicivorax TaxID=13658 RepID=A0A915IT23_ROMCU